MLHSLQMIAHFQTFRGQGNPTLNWASQDYDASGEGRTMHSSKLSKIAASANT